ncbi:MAG: hypothetical protein ACTHK4_02250 [Mycobacteriales bacterium]
MSPGSHRSSSRTFLGIMGLVILGVLGLGTTALIAAPATQPGGNGTATMSTAAPTNGTDGQRLINWSGITWFVYPNCSNCGPEQTPTTDAAKAVYVDSQGRLHLQITKIGGVWSGVELRALNRPTYATYRWVVDSATADMDPWTVLGMFVYKPGAKKFTSEIDIENSRYPHLLPAPDNSQFVVQPYAVKGNLHPYRLFPSYHPMLQQFTWMPGLKYGAPGRVDYETHLGTNLQGPLVEKWSYTGYSVPSPQGMQLFVVLWMNQNKPPTTGTHSAVIRSLTIQPYGG